MFRKLVSNVSFSPALVGQLGFYARRLKKEEATRRIGLIFTALALVVQSFAVFSAPEPANAASSNDMIRGGVSSKQQLMNHYDANTNSIKSFYTDIGITREELRTTTNGTVNSKSGALSWGLRPQFSAAQGEKRYTVQKSNGSSATFYSRPVRLWDTSNYTKQNGSTYQVYVGHSKKFGWFAIMKNCGNLMTKKHPKPPVKPKPVAVCRSLTTIKKGDDTRQFRATSDTQNGATIKSYTFKVTNWKNETVHTEVVKTSSKTATTKTRKYDPRTYTVVVEVATSVGTKTSQACKDKFTIPKQGISLSKTVNNENHAEVDINEEFTYRIAVKNLGDTTLKNLKVTDPAPKNVTFVSTPKGKIDNNAWSYTIPELKAGESTRFSIKAKLTAAAAGTTNPIKNTACVDTPSIPGEPDDCDDATVEPPEKMIEVCDLQTGELITIKETDFDESAHSKDIEDCASAVTSSKNAVNITQGGVDATDVRARASDRITYTISMQNKGQQTAEVNFVEQLDDVLEYAKITDTGGAEYDKDKKTLTWPAIELGAGEEASRSFTVQLAATTPAAARGVSDKTSYDCIMLNTFGNAVEVEVECAAPKEVEQVVTELPQTGPTENIIFGGVLLAVVVYFYARSRQLGTEVRLIRRGVNTGTI